MTDRLRPIMVVNFVRYNPPPSTLSSSRRKDDSLPLNWVRWETDAHRNQDLLDLPKGERWLWPTLLGLAGRGIPHGVVKMTPTQLAREADLTEEEVRHALAHLCRKGLIKYTTRAALAVTTSAPLEEVAGTTRIVAKS